MYLTTKLKDNDLNPSSNCAEYSKCPNWYKTINIIVIIY